MWTVLAGLSGCKGTENLNNLARDGEGRSVEVLYEGKENSETLMVSRGWFSLSHFHRDCRLGSAGK